LANLVQQLLGADGSGLGADLSSEELRHRLCKLTAFHDAGWHPYARASKRSMLPPLSRDDDEITPAENRAAILARDSDAPSRRRDSGAQVRCDLSPRRSQFYVQKVL
jgi:hypothetical protein